MHRLFLTCLLVSGAAPVAAATLSATENAGRWAVTCDEAGRECSFSQALLAVETQERLATLTVTLTADGAEVPTRVVAPLGIAVEPGVRLVAPSGLEVALATKVCLPDGCTTYAAMPRATLDRVIAEGEVSVRFFGFAADAPIAATMSLDGLAEAIATSPLYADR